MSFTKLAGTKCRTTGPAVGQTRLAAAISRWNGSNPEANHSQVQQMLRARCLWSATRRRRTPSYEKNAIFSAWLMRRIGASGSLAAVTGFFKRPLAIRLEPSDISTTGAGAGAGGA